MQRLALVTGASGFIGTHLVHELVTHGWRVRALCHRGEAERFSKTLGVEIGIGSILDTDSLQRAIANCTHVFHLAAQTNPSGPNPGSFRLNNVIGTENVMRASRDAGVGRVIYRSSTGVYGRIARGPATLDSPIKPDTPYRKSKWLGERVARAYASDGLPVVIARVSTAYGPGSKNRLHIFRDVLTGRFRMYGSGDNRDHPVFAADLAAGIRLCAETPGIEGRTYILAGKEARPVREEVNMIADCLGMKLSCKARHLLPLKMLQNACDASFRVSGYDFNLVERLAFFLSDRAFDNSTARNEIGYEPATGLTEGLERTFAWYRDQGFIGA